MLQVATHLFDRRQSDGTPLIRPHPGSKDVDVGLSTWIVLPQILISLVTDDLGIPYNETGERAATLC